MQILGSAAAELGEELFKIPGTTKPNTNITKKTMTTTLLNNFSVFTMDMPHNDNLIIKRNKKKK